LDKLIYTNKTTNDEIVILLDNQYAKVGCPSYEIIANTFHNYCGIPTDRGILASHDLNNDYGAHKNFGIEKCSGDFIFQIDGDEMPPDSLIGENLHAIIESNPVIEAYAVPRINDFRGVTPEHAKQWGWRLDTSPTYNRPRVMWPDYQWRIFKKDFPRISFTRRLHEKIEGYKKYTIFPDDEEYALYHDKTIETQLATNIRYNKLFTESENRGHSVFNK
jgi:glycosyltransferase involved in cell wall biosynthesis